MSGRCSAFQKVVPFRVCLNLLRRAFQRRFGRGPMRLASPVEQTAIARMARHAGGQA